MEYITEIEVNDIPIEVVVGYEYEPPEGDGWHSPRLAESVSIYSVTDLNGSAVYYTKDHEAFLIDEILAHIHRQAEEYRMDKADYDYECWKDRRMGI